MNSKFYRTIFVSVLLTILTYAYISILLNVAYAMPLDHKSVDVRQVFPKQNLWDVLANDFSLPDENTQNFAVQRAINWYLQHPSYLQLIALRAKPYLYYVYQEIRKRNLPAEVALLPIVESSYDPSAQSSVGALGLWQMMPDTALSLGLQLNWWYDGRKDIVASTNSALDYLAYLGRFFHGDWLLAIAAYDTGEGSVNNALRRNLQTGDVIDFWHLWLPKETQEYVPKLLALATIVKDPGEFGIRLPYIEDTPYLEKVVLTSPMDLKNIAQLAQMNLKDLTKLNPGFSYWSMSPDMHHALLLPIDKVDIFEKNVKKNVKKNHIFWLQYRVKPSDSLQNIANHYHIPLSVIQRLNGLKSQKIRADMMILIPYSSSAPLLKTIVNSNTNQASLSYSRFHSNKNDSTPGQRKQLRRIIYRVRKEDNLHTIAQAYHINIYDITRWNNLRNQLRLTPSQMLVLYVR